jgi:hypothetical protein
VIRIAKVALRNKTTNFETSCKLLTNNFCFFQVQIFQGTLDENKEKKL